MLNEIANECLGAQWVRAKGESADALDRTQAVLFRLEIEVNAPVKRAEIRISAADRYRLYVNGESVVCGPRKGDALNRYFETVDLAPYLKSGRNALTARVISYAYDCATGGIGAPKSIYVAPTGAVLMCRGEVETLEGKIALSTGEANWTACQDESFALHSEGAVYVGALEDFDAARCPDWRNEEAMGWESAVIAFGSGINDYGEFTPLPLKGRAIPNMEEIRMDFVAQLPVREGEKGFAFDESGRAVIPAGETRVLEMDAGVLRTAYFRMKIRGEGGTVRVTYAERYFPIRDEDPTGPMRRSDRENGKLTGYYDEIRVCGEEKLFESFWWRTFRFVRITAQAGSEPLELTRPDFIQTAYPLKVRAEFLFPEKKMEKLWDISLRTLRSCMHETHEDCPYYEQLQYTLDTRLQMLFTYAVSGDTRMAENVLWDFRCSQLPDGILQSRTPCTHTQVIPDFSIYWIFMLEEFYWQTGRTDLIRFYRPVMDGVLDYFDRHIGPSGLAEKLGYWEFGDWVDKWDGHAGTPDATYAGPAALHNLTYALGLRAAARMMHAVGREELRRDYDSRADHICEKVYQLCFDKTRGMLREGPNFEQFSQHSQALAVLCGALTGEEAKIAMEKALTEPGVLACTFPWQYTLLRALEKTGLYDLTAPLWAQYFSMLDRDLTTVPERPGNTRSDCHAWSALPLYEYPRMLLGVQLDAPGWERIRVKPHALGLKELSGVVPTPKGEVRVGWHVEDKGQMHLCVQGPDVPLIIEVNGKTYYAEHGAMEF